MRSGKFYFLYIPLTIAITGLALTGCRKENGIENNNVIRTPYGLYFSDALGALHQTNDGKTYKHIYPGDNIKPRAIATSGNHNVLWVKKDLFLTDNDRNFNVKNSTVNPAALWQSLILNVMNVPNLDVVFVASTKGFGVEMSSDHGLTWTTDNAVHPASPSPNAINSFTQLANGRIFGLENSTGALYRRDPSSGWDTIIATTPLPAGNFYLSHINNTILAADYKGAGGVWFTNDYGWTWTQYAGLPTNQQILSVGGPLDQVVLAGTDSTGIYRLVGNTFQPSNNGLKPFTSVYGIVGKQDTYKNAVIKQYIYIATNKGLFRSEDLGQNWVLMYQEDIRSLY
jgi:hypothetical protein